MTITAKFASKCPRCDGRINAGEQVEWARGRKAEHVICPNGRPTMAEARADFDAHTAKARRFADVGTDDDDRSYNAWRQHIENAVNDDRPQPFVADDSDEIEIVEPQTRYALPSFVAPRRSRWSRPDDDELESAADPIDNWLANKLGRRSGSEEAA